MAEIANVKLEDVLHDFRPFLVVYKDGEVQRFRGLDTVPPSVDSLTRVESKDVLINTGTQVYARLYKPQSVQRVGVIVYYHGGGFCIETAMSPFYHNYLNKLSYEANMIVVSVDYRIAPEHVLPIGYEDCWDGLKWVFKADHDEPWIKDHVDLSRVFLAGDSAGGNIVHNMAKRAGNYEKQYVLKGIVLVHPYFWGKDRIGSEEQLIESGALGLLPGKMWMVAYPGSSGLDDPQLNPGMDNELGELGVDKVMVYVAEHDTLRERGFYYKDVLLKSGWKGDVNVMEAFGEDHVFHLDEPLCPDAIELMKHMVAFLNS